MHPDGILPHVAAALNAAGFRTLTAPLIWAGEGDPVEAFERVAMQEPDLDMYLAIGGEHAPRALVRRTLNGEKRERERLDFRAWIEVEGGENV